MRICMLAYSFYAEDNRIMRYAETLAKRGDTVDVIALRRKGQARFLRLNGVNVYRIQKRECNEVGPFSYLWKLIRFLVMSSWCLSVRHIAKRYDLVHVHSVPDFEVFAAWLPRLTGAKIILDIHDIVPEFYLSKFGGTRKSLLFRTLVMVERLSIAFSHHVIISNHLWHKTITSRSAPPEKCSVVLNYVDREIFKPLPRKRKDDRFIILYPGGLHWHQGVDITIRAMALVQRQLPHCRFHIYGEGSARRSLMELVQNLGLEDVVVFKSNQPIRSMARVMAESDLGVVAKRADSFGDEAFSTKILEYMASGVPVIASATTIDRYYFNESAIRFFRSGDVEDLARNIIDLARDRAARQKLSHNGLKFVQENNWEIKKWQYLELTDTLAGRTNHRASEEIQPGLAVPEKPEQASQ